jgi:hypothetical protein
MSDDLLGVLCVIPMIGLLAAGAVLIVRDTIRQRGKWGIPLKQAVCTQCGTLMPMAFRKPTSWRQAMWGGWTCAECGYELDRWGRPLAEQNTLARWVVLPAVEEADRRRPKDDRVRGRQDKTQRREDR